MIDESRICRKIYRVEAKQFIENIEKEIDNPLTKAILRKVKVKIEKNKIYLVFPNQWAKHQIEKNYKSLIKAKASEFLPNPVVVWMVRENVKQKEINLPKGEFHSVNKSMTFSNFMVGKSNILAVTIAKEIVASPGKYNLVYFYGKNGVGKTHLLHAIANSLSDHNKTIYITAEGFVRKFSKALSSSDRGRALLKIKSEFRSVDVLLIDDIQFLEKKNYFQEELFHIIDNMQILSKQVVIAADKAPKELNMIKSLKNRFISGFVCELEPLDIKLREKIIQKIATEENLMLNSEILSFLSAHLPGNARIIKNAMLKLGLVKRLFKTEPSLEEIKRLLKDLLETDASSTDIERIIKAVAEFFGIKPEDIKSPKRNKKVALARHIAMYICREVLKASLPHIGREFGGKDHASVLYAWRSIRAKLHTDYFVKKAVENIVKSLEVV